MKRFYMWFVLVGVLSRRLLAGLLEHGLLALVILLTALAYTQWAARQLGLRRPAGAAGSA